MGFGVKGIMFLILDHLMWIYEANQRRVLFPLIKDDGRDNISIWGYFEAGI